MNFICFFVYYVLLLKYIVLYVNILFCKRKIGKNYYILRNLINYILMLFNCKRLFIIRYFRIYYKKYFI